MFRKISEGDVFATNKENSCTSGPRTAILADGSFACAFMVNSTGGANDFVPMIAYSKDGSTWTEAKPVWPELEGKKSVFVSLRGAGDGQVCLAGKAWDIAYPGEPFWSDEAAGMKENKLVFSLSADGHSFPLPTEVDVPFYGSAEQPGGMLAEDSGKLTMIYSPYPTIEKKEEADINCMGVLRSVDGGKTFSAGKFAQVDGPCQYGESWITRLTDGRLFVSTWQTAVPEKSTQYLLSDDDGATFAGPFVQPFRGQSTGIAAWKDGSVLIAYNQRKEGTVGVWLAMEKFNGTEVEVLENEPVWEANTITKSGTSGDFSQWTDFSFGEPSVTVLPDDSLLVTLWYQQNGVNGIRYVRLVRE